MNFPSTKILGSRVHMLEMADILKIMEQMILNERNIFHRIVVTGMHGVIVGHYDLAFKTILNTADLFVPDGISLVWIGRLKGFHIRKRATGTDLMMGFFKLADKNNYSCYFYGDTQDTLDRLRPRLQAEFPGMKWVGAYSPPFRHISPEEDKEIVRNVNEAKPDVLWVGLGLPKQERWIYDHANSLKVPVAVGVGAAFGFLSGKIKRAPAWMGDLGFEWLWRLVQEPRKMWRRDLIDGPCFLYHVILELLGIGKYK